MTFQGHSRFDRPVMISYPPIVTRPASVSITVYDMMSVVVYELNCTDQSAKCDNGD